ncbi:MAG TPA: hypothetical protein DCZ10_13850 [Pelotomaculum sp.]|nr:hypothetical protein [Pelotomaculum sp.]
MDKFFFLHPGKLFLWVFVLKPSAWEANPLAVVTKPLVSCFIIMIELKTELTPYEKRCQFT